MTLSSKNYSYEHEETFGGRERSMMAGFVRERERLVPWSSSLQNGSKARADDRTISTGGPGAAWTDSVSAMHSRGRAGQRRERAQQV